MPNLAGFYWDFSREIFHIGSLSIRWYGLLFAMGFFIGYQIMLKIYNFEGKTQKQLDSLSITMILSTVIGARLGHCFFYEPSIYLTNPFLILKVWEGGLASHGAGIGIIFGLWLYSRKNSDISIMWILDRIVIVVALAGFFIRLGNFFNSEIYGIPTNVAWGVIFAKVDNIVRHPVQLYESFSYLIIYFFLKFNYEKTKPDIPSGRLFGYFLVLVFGVRIVLEIFKSRQTEFLNGMPFDMGQLLSIPFVLTGLYFLIKSFNKK